MTERPLSAIVLAAGEGTRMRSTRPKPLHLLCGRAMLLYVLDALAECDTRRAVIVVGHGAERVTKKLQEEAPDLVLDFVEQHVQRGTGDAVSVGLTGFPDDDLDEEDGDVLVLPGDTPLLRPDDGRRARAPTTATPSAACTLLTARLADPTRLRPRRARQGRPGRPRRRAARRHRRGARDRRGQHLDLLLPPQPAGARPCAGSSPENAQGEYYLTDVVEVLHDAGLPGRGRGGRPTPDETQGVNDRVQLAEAEAELRRRTNERWLRLGVTMLDPERTYIDATVGSPPTSRSSPARCCRAAA